MLSVIRLACSGIRDIIIYGESRRFRNLPKWPPSDDFAIMFLRFMKRKREIPIANYSGILRIYSLYCTRTQDWNNLGEETSFIYSGPMDVRYR